MSGRAHLLGLPVFEALKQVGRHAQRHGDVAWALSKESLDVFVEFLVRHVVERVCPFRDRIHR